MTKDLFSSHKQLQTYCESENFIGYDPYDTLNSFINFKMFGKWGGPIAIQIQKRNPINIRPLIGVKKGTNPKAIGLFLKSYSLLYNKTRETQYLKKAEWFFNWLNTNYSGGYSGKCWGYNFDWANPNDYTSASTPSVVVTSFVVDGLFEYYKATKNNNAKEAIISASKYILQDIPITNFEEGICFSYTSLSKDCCYNASLLAAEVLAKTDYINNSLSNERIIEQAINFVLAKQHENGEWWYSYNPETNNERKQIDFHQGFILTSLFNLNNLRKKPDKRVVEAIKKGLHYYKNYQFFPSGRSLWRIPKKWPIEIHNQSQGIITFSKLKEFDQDQNKFEETIAHWTIRNMQSKNGFFYYRKTPLFTNKISYMRWSQAWMFLALTELLVNNDS